MKSPYAKFMVSLEFHAIYDIVLWMKDSQIPFLAKIHHMATFSNSNKTVKFFYRATGQHDPEVIKKQPSTIAILDIKIPRNDIALLRIRYPELQFKTYRPSPNAFKKSRYA